MYKVTGTFSVEIKKAPLEITGISVLGSQEVQVFEVEDVTQIYTLEIKDQYGDIVEPGAPITWSLTNNLPGVEIASSDNTQAEIVIPAGTFEHTFNLRAMAENSVYGEIGVVLTLEEVEPEEPEDSGLLYALVGGNVFSEQDKIRVFDVEDMGDSQSESFPYRINNVALTTGSGSDKYLYTTSGGNALEQERRLRKLDAKTLVVLQESVAFDSVSIPTNVLADSDFIYASFRDSMTTYGSIRKFNTATLELESQSVDIGAIQSKNMIMDGDFLYASVGSYSSGSIKKISKTSLQEIETIPISNYFSFAIGGDYVYYILRPFDTPDTLHRINKHTLVLEQSIEDVVGEPDIDKLMADDSYLYIFRGGPNRVCKFGSNLNPLEEREIDYPIREVAQDSEFLYVGSASEPNTITKLRKSDLEVQEISATFEDRLFALRR